jgi:MtN3 and saliva related transmembrane protein
MVEPATLFVTLIGCAMSAAYFPQAARIIRHRSAHDISIPTYVVFALGTLSWTIYGIARQDWPVTASFGLGVLGSWAVLLSAIRYRKAFPHA